YFVFVASDGYKVVFSWNEIYNTATGNQSFILTELKGSILANLEQRILFISTADEKTGRRYVKGLQRIEVRRAE
ncbi:MAG: molybdopterin-binding protein, partial [Bacteroidota bacterium]